MTTNRYLLREVPPSEVSCEFPAITAAFVEVYNLQLAFEKAEEWLVPVLDPLPDTQLEANILLTTNDYYVIDATVLLGDKIRSSIHEYAPAWVLRKLLVTRNTMHTFELVQDAWISKMSHVNRVILLFSRFGLQDI